MDAHVEELLNLRAGAKFLWPIPDTGVSRRLPRIKAPTLIVTSDKDVIVPAKSSEFVMERVGAEDKTLKIYEELTHATLHDRQREEVWQDIIDWLETRRQPARLADTPQTEKVQDCSRYPSSC